MQPSMAKRQAPLFFFFFFFFFFFRFGSEARSREPGAGRPGPRDPPAGRGRPAVAAEDSSWTCDRMLRQRLPMVALFHDLAKLGLD